MKIHALAYVVIGIIILLVSYYLDKQKFMLFIIIGAIMIAIGTAKLVFKFISKDKSIQQTHYRVDQKAANRVAQRYCPYCGSPQTSIGYYCQFCGGRIR